MSTPEKPSQHVVKICVIGDSGVGKSHLVAKYDTGAFPKLHPTSGVSLSTGTLWNSSSYLELDAKLRIWDTSGDDSYITLSTSYIQGSDVILLCYDVGNAYTFLRMKTVWMTRCKDLLDEKSDPVFAVVGLKADQTKSVRTSDGKAFAASCNGLFFEISAKNESRKAVKAVFHEAAVASLLMKKGIAFTRRRQGSVRLPAVAPQQLEVRPLLANDKKSKQRSGSSSSLHTKPFANQAEFTAALRIILKKHRPSRNQLWGTAYSASMGTLDLDESSGGDRLRSDMERLKTSKPRVKAMIDLLATHHGVIPHISESGGGIGGLPPPERDFYNAAVDETLDDLHRCVAPHITRELMAQSNAKHLFVTSSGGACGGGGWLFFGGGDRGGSSATTPPTTTTTMTEDDAMSSIGVERQIRLAAALDPELQYLLVPVSQWDPFK